MLKEEVEQVNAQIREFLKQLARQNEIENPNKLRIESSQNQQESGDISGYNDDRKE